MEEKLFGGGVIASPLDERDYNLKKLVKSAVKLPDEFETNIPMDILNQEQSECCVGCYLAQTARILEYKNNGKLNRYSPADRYGDRDVKDFKGEGMIPREAIKRFVKKGICLYDTFPGFWNYSTANNKYNLNSEFIDNEAYPYKGGSFYRLNSIEDIKKAIYTIGVAGGAYDVYKCLYYPDEKGNIKFDKSSCGESYGGHMLTIYGWNKTGFKIINSWGEDYGNHGLIVIPYEYLPTEAWAIVDDETNGRIVKEYQLVEDIALKIINYKNEILGGIKIWLQSLRLKITSVKHQCALKLHTNFSEKYYLA